MLSDLLVDLLISLLPITWFVVMALAVFFRMREYWATLAVMCVGAALNFAAVGANGGKMPVYTKHWGLVRTLPYNEFHKLADDKTRLPFLCDWIHVGYNSVISPGDILVFGGELFAFVYLYLVMTNVLAKREGKPRP